ncbi:MAG TPA: phage baseplate assembly protein V [Longimicrobiaceae bacterium]|nr:phage baseplate assembly protein V [Longimicrobiaceae bacterium]
MSGQGGVVTAVVATAPDDQGRLGVRYPWLPQGETLPPVYAPVAAALAGTSRGAWLMPEEGDEVLVAFERGDWNRPFVVGFLWNGAHAPPETDRRNRVIVTPGGHTLRFEDGDAKKVVLRTAGGHSVTLDDAGGSATVSVPGGASSVVLEASQVTIRGGGHSITLSASGVAIT